MKSEGSRSVLNAPHIALKLSTFLPPGPHGHIVLVTSVHAGEGKSFVASLLAQEVSGSLGLKLVLVDGAGHADGAGKAAGFSELISRDDLADMTLAHKSGTRVPFLNGGLGLSKAVFNVDGVKRAFSALRASYQVVLIDGPSLDECGALLLHADAVVLVVDSRHTPPDAIRHALATAELNPDRIAGVLLNHALPGAA